MVAIEQAYVSGDTLHLQPNHQLDINKLQPIELYDSSITGKKGLLRARYQGQALILDQVSLGSPLSWYERKTIEATTVILKNLGRLGLSILSVLGHLEDNEHGLMFAFRVPSNVSSKEHPVTLYKLFLGHESVIPNLNERLKLARALTSTIFALHSVEWYHGDIRSQNILFWSQPQSKQRKLNINEPYLVGFGTLTLNRMLEVSEKADVAGKKAIHGHPGTHSMPQRQFQPMFDIYSLGVVLCEIGMWHSMDSKFLGLNFKVQDPHTGTRLQEELGRYIGQRYADAVMACLSPELERIRKQHPDDHQKQLRTYLDWVQDNIVDPIARCDV